MNFEMEKKNIILMAIYAVVLCIVAAASLIFASLSNVTITARFSPWLSPDEEDNLLQLEVANPQNARFDQSQIYIGWYDPGFIGNDDLALRYARPGYNGYDEVIRVDLPSHGTVLSNIPKCEYQHGRHCPNRDLRFLLQTGKYGDDKLDVDGGKLSFDNPDNFIMEVEKSHLDGRPGIEVYSIMPFGLAHNPSSHSIQKLVVPAAFMPGKSNRVLYADIRDGMPYQGDIVIQQVPGAGNTDPDEIQIDGIAYRKNANNGAVEYVINADESGVTAFEIMAQKQTRIRILAGTEVTEKTIKPGEMPFSAVSTSDEDGKTRIHVSFAGEPQDMVVDYFSGNMWFYHQEVKAADTAGFELIPMHLKPHRRSWNDTQELVYARLSLRGNSEDAYHQTIPVIVSYQNEPESDAFRIGLLYQEFVRLHDLEAGDYDNAMKAAENIYNLYNDPKRQRDTWCSDIFAFVPVLLSDRNKGWVRVGWQKKQQFKLQDKNIEEYLLTRLVQSHHPEMMSVEFKGTSDVKKTCRTGFVFWLIWIIVGFAGFLVYGLRVRAQRQKAWFDDAARHKAVGVLPGMPVWIMAVIAVLALMLVYVFYETIQIL